jgi:hypothetical protein
MGSEHRPEVWVILKISFVDGSNGFYKVFGSWRGGFVGSDAWRLSSGADSLATIEEKDDELTWSQSSGSVYQMHKYSQGRLGPYCQRVLDMFIEDSEKHGTTIEVVEY